jgi:hypothetical protein
VDSLECSKKYGEAWEEQYPDDVGCMCMTYGSSKVIRNAHMRTRYPAMLSDVSSILEAAMKRELSSLDVVRGKIAKARAKKHVIFTADIVTWSTRDASYSCRDPAERRVYEPGRHAAPLGLG